MNGTPPCQGRSRGALGGVWEHGAPRKYRYRYLSTSEWVVTACGLEWRQPTAAFRDATMVRSPSTPYETGTEKKFGPPVLGC